jgi:hypothetical protein
MKQSENYESKIYPLGGPHDKIQSLKATDLTPLASSAFSSLEAHSNAVKPPRSVASSRISGEGKKTRNWLILAVILVYSGAIQR